MSKESLEYPEYPSNWVPGTFETTQYPKVGERLLAVDGEELGVVKEVREGEKFRDGRRRYRVTMEDGTVFRDI